ncbi:Ran guanine nucleotide release factor [Hypsizygus marmoreus]|uniref:Ran guanine nucleotide release factor n=1 Tax=Hypsizygus marmoreus TaxID=39966 RepID=A0A369JR49_HYPMA|nr:Ran guanine nucleotide release factor [Hypsizygus marmoreus]
MASLITRELFGGAITASMPANLVDAATLRQVPDSQEVFMYPDSGISIIIEILERVEPSHFEDAIRFHFNSIAHDNSAVSATVDAVTVIPNDRGDDTPSAIVLFGVQGVPKFNRTTPDEVHIFMALFRVEHKRADLVVTFNVPTVSQDGGMVGKEGLDAAQANFESLVRSLRIVDHRLFA